MRLVSRWLIVVGVLMIIVGFVPPVKYIYFQNNDAYFYVLLLGIALVLWGKYFSSPPKSIVRLQENRIDSSAFIEIVKGLRAGEKVAITSDNFTIGRNADNNLQLVGLDTSRFHARIRLAYGYWFIQDLGGKNPTYLNGKLVHASLLNSGDQIAIGDNIFVFHDKSVSEIE